MLHDLAALAGRYGDDRTVDIMRAVNYLLRHQFIHSGDRGTVALYATATDARFESFLRDWFDVAGYRLVANPQEQWIGLLPDAQELPLPRMRLDETVTVLLLAAVWQEEVNAGNVGSRATVATTVNALHERYSDLVGRGRAAALPPRRMLDILRELARRGIVAVAEEDVEAQDMDLTIRPTVRLLAGEAVLAKLSAFAADEEARLQPAANDDGGSDAAGDTGQEGAGRA